MLGATLAEWHKKREEEAASLAALRNSGGGEEEDDRPRKKTPGQIAYEKKQQRKRIVAESQALMNQKKATQQAQNKIAKDKNLAKAEAVMSKAKPVTPYVASAYIDKEEETWLKGVASQGAWAATSDAKSEPVAIAIPLPQPVPTQPDNEGNAETPTPTLTPLTLPTGETIERTDSFQLQGTVSIHRWPRILIVAGVVIYVWEAGVVVALKAAAEALVSIPLFQQVFQAVSP